MASQAPNSWHRIFNLVSQEHKSFSIWSRRKSFLTLIHCIPSIRSLLNFSFLEVIHSARVGLFVVSCEWHRIFNLVSQENKSFSIWSRRKSFLTLIHCIPSIRSLLNFSFLEVIHSARVGLFVVSCEWHRIFNLVSQENKSFSIWSRRKSFLTLIHCIPSIRSLLNFLFLEVIHSARVGLFVVSCELS